MTAQITFTTAEQVWQDYQAFIRENYSDVDNLIENGEFYVGEFWERSYEIFLPVYGGGGGALDTVYPHHVCNMLELANGRYLVEYWKDCELHYIAVTHAAPIACSNDVSYYLKPEPQTNVSTTQERVSLLRLAQSYLRRAANFVHHATKGTDLSDVTMRYTLPHIRRIAEPPTNPTETRYTYSVENLATALQEKDKE